MLAEQTKIFPEDATDIGCPLVAKSVPLSRLDQPRHLGPRSPPPPKRRLVGTQTQAPPPEACLDPPSAARPEDSKEDTVAEGTGRSWLTFRTDSCRRSGRYAPGRESVFQDIPLESVMV